MRRRARGARPKASPSSSEKKSGITKHSATSDSLPVTAEWNAGLSHTSFTTSSARAASGSGAKSSPERGWAARASLTASPSPS